MVAEETTVNLYEMNIRILVILALVQTQAAADDTSLSKFSTFEEAMMHVFVGESIQSNSEQ